MKNSLAGNLRETFARAVAARDEAERNKKMLAMQAKKRAAEQERQRVLQAEFKRMELFEFKKNIKTIYHSLAASAWRGESSVRCAQNFAPHVGEIRPYGIKIIDQSTAVDFLNLCQANILNDLHELIEGCASFEFNLNGEIESVCKNIKKNGVLEYLRPGQNILSAVDCIEIERYKRRGVLISQLESALVKGDKDRVESVRLLSSEIARVENEIEDCISATKHLEAIAGQMAQFTGKIASDMVFRLSGCGDVSLNSRVAFLRNAFSQIYPAHDFSIYTSLDVLNIIRLANNIPAFGSLEEAERQLSGDFDGDNSHFEITVLRAKLDALSGALLAAKNAPPDARQQKIYGELLAAKERFVKIGEFHTFYERASGAIRVSHSSYCERLESYLPVSLNYRAGVYENVVLAELDLSPRRLHPEVELAHEELVWLLTRSGQRYLEKLEEALRVIAEAALSSVEIGIREKGAHGSVAEIQGKLFFANIRPVLVVYMLKLAGLKLQSSRRTDDALVIDFSW